MIRGQTESVRGAVLSGKGGSILTEEEKRSDGGKNAGRQKKEIRVGARSSPNIEDDDSQKIVIVTGGVSIVVIRAKGGRRKKH